MFQYKGDGLRIPTWHARIYQAPEVEMNAENIFSDLNFNEVVLK
ncbi:MAG: hypothetical protein WCY93_10675 [Anaerolineaceae bacterium]